MIATKETISTKFILGRDRNHLKIAIFLKIYKLFNVFRFNSGKDAFGSQTPHV